MAQPIYTKWISPEGLEKVKKWAEAGLTDIEIAGNIGVSRKTVYEWAKRFTEFGAVLEKAKGSADEIVEGALFKRATGYTVQVKKTFKLREVKYSPEGKKISEKEKLVTGMDEVHVAADTSAQKFWLTNRVPDRWKNHVEFEGTMGTGSIEEYIKRRSGEAEK